MKIVLGGSRFPIYERSCPHWRGIKEALTEMGQRFVYLDLRHDPWFGEKVVEYNPDLVICGLDDIFYSSRQMRQIRGKLPHTKVVVWYGDYRDDEISYVHESRCIGLIDAIFVSNNGQAEFFRRKFGVRARFLPLACYKIKKRYINPRLRYRNVFIGETARREGLWGQRVKLISEISKQEKVTIINSTKEKKRAAIYELMPEIYGSSDFSLDIAHFWHIPGYTSNRSWIIPMCSGLSLAKRFPGCEDFYKDRVHKLYFDTAEEAIELIKYYTKHKDKADKIRKAGHKHTLENHTYEHRLKQMFKILKV